MNNNKVIPFYLVHMCIGLKEADVLIEDLAQALEMFNLANHNLNYYFIKAPAGLNIFKN